MVIVLPETLAVPMLTFTSVGVPSNRNVSVVFVLIELPATGFVET